jgi:hypothetical protein
MLRVALQVGQFDIRYQYTTETVPTLAIIITFVALPKIEPLGNGKEGKQLITNEEYTQWSWDVTPLEPESNYYHWLSMSI